MYQSRLRKKEDDIKSPSSSFFNASAIVALCQLFSYIIICMSQCNQLELYSFDLINSTAATTK